tara:strand:+ start:476 stop:616 length:141 start_codon:yes stop_codon:yes gene_type:complete
MNEPKKLKIETPIGSVESDSGNHLVDVVTVVGFILVFFIFKRIMKN